MDHQNALLRLLSKKKSHPGERSAPSSSKAAPHPQGTMTILGIARHDLSPFPEDQDMDILIESDSEDEYHTEGDVDEPALLWMTNTVVLTWDRRGKAGTDRTDD